MFSIAFRGDFFGEKPDVWLRFGDKKIVLQKNPSATFYVDGIKNKTTSDSGDDFLSLTKTELPVWPPKPYDCEFAKMFGKVNRRMVPKSVYEDHKHQLLNSCLKALSANVLGYWGNVWVKCSQIFDEFYPAKASEKAVDTDSLDIHDGYYKTATYDRHSSKTGRLSQVSGLKVLNLNADSRDLIASSFEGGEILCVDFTALETTILMRNAGFITDVDPYIHISNELKLDLSREDAKQCVISSMYGSGKNKLSYLIRRMLKCDELGESLLHESKSGTIRSLTGRPITVDDDKQNTLINNTIQSTGVDVSLSGFSSLTRQMRQNGMCSKPLYVLHDGLIIDVHPNELVWFNHQLKAISIDISDRLFSVPFGVKVKNFFGGKNEKK